MATAMFQCISNEVAIKLSQGILANPPWLGGRTRVSGRLCWFIFSGEFDGSCKAVYEYFMNLVTNWPGYVAFIGIDETSNYQEDPYNLQIIDTIPQLPHQRDVEDNQSYMALQQDFLNVIVGTRYTYEEVLTICQRCYIGQDLMDSVKYCTTTIWQLSNASQLTQSLISLVSGPNAFTYSEDNSNTLVRCMAHFCYLLRDRFRCVW